MPNLDFIGNSAFEGNSSFFVVSVHDCAVVVIPRHQSKRAVGVKISQSELIFSAFIWRKCIYIPLICECNRVTDDVVVNIMENYSAALQSLNDEKWQRLSVPEKLSLLQEIENETAVREGLSPREALEQAVEFELLCLRNRNYHWSTLIDRNQRRIDRLTFAE